MNIKSDENDSAFDKRLREMSAMTPQELAELRKQDRKKVEKAWEKWPFQGPKPELSGLSSEDEDE